MEIHERRKLPSFNIINDRWLDVLRSDGTVRTMSLRELLTDLHEIDRLSESSPLTEVALLRFLIALVSDGLRDFVPSEEAWSPFVQRCRNGLTTEAIDSILNPLASDPDVLASDHSAFFDGPQIRTVPGWDELNARQPISRFLPELPTGTNLCHFQHLSDDAAALCITCLLKSRAVDAAFARGGLGPSLSRNLLATISGTEPRYVVLRSQSLLATILINLVVGDPSRPSWIAIHRHYDDNPGPIARMGWRPRLMMPMTGSETTSKCTVCATDVRPRFRQAIMLDTYNHKKSPFGSKGDLESWKNSNQDPQLLPFVKNAFTLGSTPAEWPLRSLTRLLASGDAESVSTPLRRTALLGFPVCLTVTSSAGNKAKIDDAPDSALRVPITLLQHSAERRAEIAAAMITIFESKNRNVRNRLIPRETPHLLDALAVTTDPTTTVDNWLSQEDTSRRKRSKETATDCVSYGISTDSIKESARDVIQRLMKLSRRELGALRPNRRGGAVDRAERQAAFEALWHRLSLPGVSKRHALREAVATLVGIFAIHADRASFSSNPGAFSELLKGRIQRERSQHAQRDGIGPIERLLTRLVTATVVARDVLLLQLVDQLVETESSANSRPIDFADLLIDLILWNDRQDPTPGRWKRTLNQQSVMATNR